MYKVEVIADSINNGNRIITLRCTYPRIIHSEMMTHRMFSRNASSSRAIGINRMISAVESNPFIPESWPAERSGMSADHNLEGLEESIAKMYWQSACSSAIGWAKALRDAGVHKQIVNRVLEPYSWITVLITATEWKNFFQLRCAPDAQPEIQKIANMMRDALNESDPIKSQFHEPFLEKGHGHSVMTAARISAGRCARVSYDKDSADEEANFKLANRLLESKHLSPFEHYAMSSGRGFTRNFKGWKSVRSMMEDGQYNIWSRAADLSQGSTMNKEHYA